MYNAEFLTSNLTRIDPKTVPVCHYKRYSCGLMDVAAASQYIPLTENFDGILEAREDPVVR